MLMLWHRANVCTNIKINVINFLKLYNQVNKPTHRITRFLIKLSDPYYSILKDKAKTIE